LTYQVLYSCDYGDSSETCGSRRELVAEDGDGVERKLGAVDGFSFDEWNHAIEYYRYDLGSCALAPVRSKEQLEFYRTWIVTLTGSGTETLLGIMLKDEMDAYACRLAHMQQSASPSPTPKECLDGWINIVDGSDVPAEKELWNEGRPVGGTYANLARWNGQNYMYDQYNPDHNRANTALFPYALVECCTNPTCYYDRGRNMM
jgi:hypothetical protein